MNGWALQGLLVGTILVVARDGFLRFRLVGFKSIPWSGLAPPVSALDCGSKVFHCGLASDWAAVLSECGSVCVAMGDAGWFEV